METNQPTQEQIKEFWEWCGLKVRFDTDGTCYRVDDMTFGNLYLDLNNLFKYAVPKLEEEGWDWYISPNRVILQRGDSYYEQLYSDHNPALALFWAIWGVIHATT